MGSATSSSQVARGLLFSFHQKMKLIKHQVLFQGLTNENLLDLTTCFSALKIRNGETANFSPDQTYFIVEGELRAVVSNSSVYQDEKETKEQSEDFFVYQCLPGQLIHAFRPDSDKTRGKRSGNKQYNLRYECVETAIVLQLKEEDTKGLLNYHCKQRQINYHFVSVISILTTGLYPSLLELKFLKSATPMQLKVFAENCKLQSFREGQIIFQEGDFGNTMYHVMEGAVTVSLGRPVDKLTEFRKELIRQDSCPSLIRYHVPANVPLQQPRQLYQNRNKKRNRLSITSQEPFFDGIVGVIKPPGYFGVSSMVEPEPRTYTARSSGRCLLLTVEGESIKHFFNYYPSIKKAVEGFRMERVLRKAKQMGIPLFSAVHETAFESFGKGCFIHRYNHKAVIRSHQTDFSPAAPADGMVKKRRSIFTVLQGEVELVDIVTPRSNCDAIQRLTESEKQQSLLPVLSVHKVGDHSSPGLEGVMHVGSFVVQGNLEKEESNQNLMHMVAHGRQGATILEITEKAEQVLHANIDAHTQYEICVLRKNSRLGDIIHNEKATFWFRTFLKNEQQIQNDSERNSLTNQLDFLLETEKWKASVAEQSEAGKIMAQLIATTYIDEQSSCKVDVNLALQQSILRDVQELLLTPVSGVEDPQMFDAVFKEVFTRIESGPFEKFLDSWEFSELLESFSSERWSQPRTSFVIPSRSRSPHQKRSSV